MAVFRCIAASETHAQVSFHLLELSEQRVLAAIEQFNNGESGSVDSVPKCPDMLHCVAAHPDLAGKESNFDPTNCFQCSDSCVSSPVHSSIRHDVGSRNDVPHPLWFQRQRQDASCRVVQSLHERPCLDYERPAGERDGDDQAVTVLAE